MLLSRFCDFDVCKCILYLVFVAGGAIVVAATAVVDVVAAVVVVISYIVDDVDAIVVCDVGS